MKLVFIIFIFFSYNHSKDSNFFYFSEDGMKFKKKTFWDLANFTNQTKKYLQHLQFFLQHKFLKTIQNTKPDK